MQKRISYKMLLIKSSIIIFLLGLFGFTSCDKDDDIQPEYGVPVSLIDNNK